MRVRRSSAACIGTLVAHGMFELPFVSPIGPGFARAFTNSPHFDSNEFSLFAPAPEPAEWLLLGAGFVALGLRRRAGLRAARFLG
jgi:hypothetical protein